jgi:hypothetical protein
MKEFLPTFTFGFLMAQLFPGATAVISLTCGFITATSGVQVSLMRLFSLSGDLWFSSVRNTTAFFFVSVGVGMFLHGLDWMTIASMENKYNAGIVSFPFHKWRLVVQFLTSPANVIYELGFLLSRENMESAIMEENAPKVAPASMPNFGYLQDFYLYFAQFFVHMSYALGLSLIVFVIVIYQMGFTKYRMFFLVLTYLILSAFFLMGRAQLYSLFKAENDLLDHKATSEPTLVEVSTKENTPLGLEVSMQDKAPIGIELRVKDSETDSK